MDTYNKITTFDGVNGKIVIGQKIADFINSARYLDGMEISIKIDGKGNGTGTVESFSYSISIKHKADCITY